ESPQTNDIKTQFHPNSGIPPKVHSFEEFGHRKVSETPVPLDFSPWRPFQSRLDFEVSEFALQAGLSDNLTTDLIDLLQRCCDQREKFTIKSSSEMKQLWDLASVKSLKFEKSSIAVEYQGKPKDFDVHYRPLWDWVEEIATNQDLSSEIVWDAQRLWKFDGSKWEKFIEEPWSASAWWNIQGKLPADSKPFFIILYADKNKLSSFGTQKGYPVIARCANLPSSIRNGTGIGGGRLVGWLPIVDEDPAETGKPGFVNFKNAVWHESVRKIIESLIPHSQTGCALVCGDDVTRSLFPIPFILSADYEEQCVMALIRGLGGLCPCPKCFVSQEDLSDLSVQFQLRTPVHTLEIFQQVKKCTTQVEKENILKEFSLRPHMNVFLDLNHVDPYFACSFDELHFDSSGLWGDHLFAQFKRHLDALPGRAGSVTVDSRYAQMPRWSKLNHFNSVTGTSFNDGSKHRDISKIFIFAAHDVFDQKSAAFQLLRALRSYLNMTMYGDLVIQTDSTIESGRSAVNNFSGMILVRNEELAKKSWNFIKMHYHVHLFDDIMAKGVSQVFSTKPNEKMHGPLRKIYHHRTNFKNIADQILRIQHQFMVATVIRAGLDTLDEYYSAPIDQEESDLQYFSKHFHLGSKCQPIALQEVENAHKSDTSFSRFRIELGKFMTGFLRVGKEIRFTPNDIITPFQYLNINYQSMETWEMETDQLRCNPNFYNQPRFDFVMFQKSEGNFSYAQLLYMFDCSVDEKHYPVACIQHYKVVLNRSAVDRRLGLVRIRKDFSKDAPKFIPIDSVVRGIVAPVAGSASEISVTERFIFDVVDGDMFLRIKKLYPGFTDTQ
ncbi:hypothetical protein K435DRAFT_675329, partial [Dendrothele bispora CBS 962.96]